MRFRTMACLLCILDLFSPLQSGVFLRLLTIAPYAHRIAKVRRKMNEWIGICRKRVRWNRFLSFFLLIWWCCDSQRQSSWWWWNENFGFIFTNEGENDVFFPHISHGFSTAILFDYDYDFGNVNATFFFLFASFFTSFAKSNHFSSRLKNNSAKASDCKSFVRRPAWIQI